MRLYWIKSYNSCKKKIISKHSYSKKNLDIIDDTKT